MMPTFQAADLNGAPLGRDELLAEAPVLVILLRGLG
jgi:hypothetical protein